MTATPPYRVQVMIGPGLEYFRETLLGVRQYGFETGRLAFVDRWLEHDWGEVAAAVRRDRVDGIVAAVHSTALEARLAALRVPVVNVSNSMIRPRLPVVTQDDHAVGRLAADHLLECGARSFGFWGQAGAAYAEERLVGFRERLAEAGWARALRVGRGAAPAAADGRAGIARMRRWLADLPRPAGVFAVLDTLALRLMRAVREQGWRVPEDVAVLGAGDDDLWVEFERTPLSSLRLPARAIGCEAGRVLDELITAGRRRRSGPVRLGGARVVARRSSEVWWVEDEAVGRALRYIRAEATRNPYVGEIARCAGVSRSALQARFRRVVGRTLLAEIQRVRIAEARRWLETTELPLKDVADRCGFPNTQRFSVLFRQATGLSPGACRRAARAGLARAT